MQTHRYKTVYNDKACSMIKLKLMNGPTQMARQLRCVNSKDKDSRTVRPQVNLFTHFTHEPKSLVSAVKFKADYTCMTGYLTVLSLTQNKQDIRNYTALFFQHSRLPTPYTRFI